MGNDLALMQMFPRDVDSLHLHGTGTSLGDPIEVSKTIQTNKPDLDRDTLNGNRG